MTHGKPDDPVLAVLSPNSPVPALQRSAYLPATSNAGRSEIISPASSATPSINGAQVRKDLAYLGNLSQPGRLPQEVIAVLRHRLSIVNGRPASSASATWPARYCIWQIQS